MSAKEVTRVREAVLANIKAGKLEETDFDLKALVATTLVAELHPTRSPEAQAAPDRVNRDSLIVHLVTQSLAGRKCAICRGALIGREIAESTCGHCGGRSINPTEV